MERRCCEVYGVTVEGVCVENWVHWTLSGFIKAENCVLSHFKVAMTKDMHVKFGCFHGGDYEECRLLGCDAVWLL
jgi:hypothetical protein